MSTVLESHLFDPAKVAVLIPAYCEAFHIGDVVRRVCEQLCTVLVIDDGSPDMTADCARQAGAEVIVHPKNAGKGAAIKTGLRVLLERKFDYVLILDADGQHIPEEIGRFLSAAAAETGSPCGIWIGNRMSRTKGMPWARWFTNRMMSRIISRLCRQTIPDSQCGFRMIHKDVIPHLFCESNSYDYETEMLLIAARRGYRVGNVPVTTVYGNEISKIKPIRDGVRFWQLLNRYR